MQPLGAADYLQLSQLFHTIVIRDVPQLNLKIKSPARRFITLIDTLYDNRVRIIISARYPLKQLFSKEPEFDDHDVAEIAMDNGKTADRASIFTGEEELFAYDRTISRLTQMQTQEYWSEWEVV